MVVLFVVLALHVVFALLVVLTILAPLAPIPVAAFAAALRPPLALESASMRSRALTTPPIFFSVSSYSAAGSLSATSPAPARTVINWSSSRSSTVAVRMTIATSASPVHEK
ncbi:hypothetical protein ACFQMM_02500 [Saliphagus sp. GCM10025308]